MHIALLFLLTGVMARAEADARAVEISRQGLQQSVVEVRSVTDAAALRSIWARYLDYLLALDSVGAYHRAQKGEESIAITYAAFLAQYRYSLDLIAEVERLAGANEVLDEPVPEIGAPAGTYARVRSRFLDAARPTELAALDSLYRRRGPKSSLHAPIEEDVRAILHAAGRAKPPGSVGNARAVATSELFTAWFPVPKGVVGWMGDTRVARGRAFFVSQLQIAALAPELEPGDVLLVRREWYLGNLGVPGYWPHAALFIGDATARRRYFDDEGVRDWVRAQGRADGDFEAWLRQHHSAPYAASRAARIIEALDERVVFTTLEYSAPSDSLAVLRPRVSKRDKALAIARAFARAGARSGIEVVSIAYQDVVGSAMSPNDLARHLDAALVVFLEGSEKNRAAAPASVEEFRASSRRPKWRWLVR